MTELTPYLTLIVLVAVLECASVARVPIGAVVAIAIFAIPAAPLPALAAAALGMLAARLALYTTGMRSARTRAARSSWNAGADRVVFAVAAFPGLPAHQLFPTLGALRAPLRPAVTGSFATRLPILALTTGLFWFVGAAFTQSDQDATRLLTVLACGLLIIRLLQAIDWEHRQRTGGWRLRRDESRITRLRTALTPSGHDPRSSRIDSHKETIDDADVIDADVLEEIIEDDDQR